jgi:hypothetical protein
VSKPSAQLEHAPRSGERDMERIEQRAWIVRARRVRVDHPVEHPRIVIVDIYVTPSSAHCAAGP